MARSDYDFINLSLGHELNEWLAERGYAGQRITGTDWQRWLPANCGTVFMWTSPGMR